MPSGSIQDPRLRGDDVLRVVHVIPAQAGIQRPAHDAIGRFTRLVEKCGSQDFIRPDQ